MCMVWVAAWLTLICVCVFVCFENFDFIGESFLVLKIKKIINNKYMATYSMYA